jgi:hypothetical protein
VRRLDRLPSRLAWTIAASAVLVAATIFLVSIRSYALVGWDTLPEIASSRIASPAGLAAAFREQTAAGYFPYGAMYRPLFNLSLGLDYALWGLDPFGYLLTGVLLYAATALAIFGLARRLFGAGAIAGPLAALGAFLLLPAHVEIVPIVSRRADMLCGLALVLGASAQVRRADMAMPRGALVPALFTALALAAKEPGVVAVPVAAAIVLAFGETRRVARAVAAGAVHALAVGVVLIGRVAAIGGMGGHPMAAPAGAVVRLPDMLARELLALAALGYGPASRAACWGATALTGVALAATTGAVLPRHGPPGRRDRLVASAGIALLWLVTSASIFGIAGLFQTWYLFVPAPAFVVLVGAIVEWSALAVSRPRPARRAAAAFLLAGTLAWLGWQGRYSPLVHRYGHWTRASAVTRRYLGDLRTRITRAPAGSVLRVPAPPAEIAADAGQPVVRQAMVLRSYSVQAWADLVFGDGRVVVREARSVRRDAEEDARVVVLLGRRPATR